MLVLSVLAVCTSEGMGCTALDLCILLLSVQLGRPPLQKTSSSLGVSLI